MTNSVRLIYVPTNDDTKTDNICDALKLYNISCFSSGNHLIVINMKPSGINIPKNIHFNLGNIINKPRVKNAMYNAHARIIAFKPTLFNHLKTSFSKQYVPVHIKSKYMSFKSKTQRASFTIYQNGLINSSKDLLVIPLWNNIIRIIEHKKPIDPTDSI